MSDAFRSPRQPPRSTVAVRDAAHSCGIDSPLVATMGVFIAGVEIRAGPSPASHPPSLASGAINGLLAVVRSHGLRMATRASRWGPPPWVAAAPAPPSHAAIGRAGPAAAAAIGAQARSRWAAAPRRSAPSVPRSGRRAAAAQSSAPGPDDVGELSPEAAGVGEAGEEMAAHLRRHCDLPPRSCARCWCGSWRLACSVMHRPCEV